MDKRIFNQLRDIVYKESGISLSDKKEQLVSARIGKRIRALKLAGQKEYLAYLIEDRSGEEMTEFLDVISTNLTSFFREPDHFETLKELFSKWWDKGQSRFRFWSAASSTGEEPYSMAISLLEVLNGRPLDIKILATDISTRTLRHCQHGVYEAKRLETLPRHLRDRYFDAVQENKEICYQAKDNLKKFISFRHFNLSKFPYPMKGPLDIIFCRNVMIYFDNELKEKLIREFYRLLKPGGYLMIGHSESLTGLPSSRFENIRPSVYFKKE
jgi:chemotaxis protein methyltransferase CheR